jgi:DHA1 family multidrug resistance protein-like MFS transporter
VEALIFLLAAWAKSPWQLALARLLSGFVMGNTGVMMALQSEITPDGRLGMAVAVIGSGPSLAMAIGPLFGGVLAAHVGLRALFLLDSIATFTAALAMVVLLREAHRRGASGPVGHLARAALADIWRYGRVRQVFLLSFFVSFGATAVMPFLPLWIRTAYGQLRGVGLLSHVPLPEVIGAVFTVAGFAMAASTPLWGWLIDRLGAVWGLRAASLGTSLGLLVQGSAPLLATIAAGRTVQGLFQGGVTPALTAVLARAAPAERRASILNLSILPQQIGWFFGPASATMAVHAFGLEGMVLFFGAFTLIGACLAFLLRPLPQGSAAFPDGGP